VPEPVAEEEDAFTEWEVAKIWQEELIRAGVKTPRTSKFAPYVCISADVAQISAPKGSQIRFNANTQVTVPAFSSIADLYWLKNALCPFALVQEVIRKRRTAEQQEALRKEAEDLLDKFLSSVGY